MAFSTAIYFVHQGRIQQKVPVPPNTQQSRSEAPSLPAKPHEAQQKPSAPSVRAHSTVSRPSPQPSLSSATAVPKAAGGSSYITSGPINFDPQPSHSQIPFGGSSSAAVLQRPPEVSPPMSLPQRAGSQQAGDTAPPSAVLKEVPAETSASIGQKGLPGSLPDTPVPHQSEPEHNDEPDDEPMEEIQLHTDTEPASNEPQEEQRHYPDTSRQSSYPLSPEPKPSEPTASNGAPSLEQSTQAASAAVAEAIAAANRAAEESSGGKLLTLASMPQTLTGVPANRMTSSQGLCYQRTCMAASPHSVLDYSVLITCQQAADLYTSHMPTHQEQSSKSRRSFTSSNSYR